MEYAFFLASIVLNYVESMLNEDGVVLRMACA